MTKTCKRVNSRRKGRQSIICKFKLAINVNPTNFIEIYNIHVDPCNHKVQNSSLNLRTGCFKFWKLEYTLKFFFFKQTQI